MARLSAYGRRELLRVERERETPGDSLISWERVQRAFCQRSPGGVIHVLAKRTVRFRNDGGAMSGERHDYGWKVRGKVKPGLSIGQVRDVYTGNGWKVVQP